MISSTSVLKHHEKNKVATYIFTPSWNNLSRKRASEYKSGRPLPEHWLSERGEIQPCFELQISLLV